MSRALLAVLGFALLVMGSAPAVAVEQPWYFDYESAVKSIEKGDYEAGQKLLEQLITVKPIPRANEPTYGAWGLDYTPYYYLGVALQARGRHDEAAKAYRASLRFGVIKRNRERLGEVQVALAECEARASKGEPETSATTNR